MQPLWKAVWRVLKKLQPEPPCGSTIHIWVCTKKNGKQRLRGLLTHRAPSSMLTTAEPWKPPHRSLTDERISETWSIRSGILFSPKKEDKLTPATTWVNLEGVIPGEINQSRRADSVRVRSHEGLEGSWRQEDGCWVPGAGGENQGASVSWGWFRFCRGRVLEAEGGDGCTAV